LLIGEATDAHAQWLPWRPQAGSPPRPVLPGPWIFFDAAEGAVMEALVDRLIPPDPDTPGGKDAGCAVFIDRQLAGPFGRRDGQYLTPPFIKGAVQQGAQDEDGPAVLYRKALAALEQYCKKEKGGGFASLSDASKDAIIGDLESGAAKLDRVDGRAFFALLLANTREGFFADPIYGGNRAMAAWKMVGYPGLPATYREDISKYFGKKYDKPPQSIADFS